jgi:hypothetical protein
MLPAVFGALFMNGACRPVVKSTTPEPLKVAIVVFAPPPIELAQNKVTLGSIVDEVPFDTFQNNFVIDRRVLPLPSDAIKVFALTLVILVSPVPSEMFVNLTAHADA